MLSINRKGFRTMPAITDNEIAGIGLVAHNWSHLEFHLDVLVNVAGGKPFNSGKGQRASFIERARYVKDEAVKQLKPQWAARLRKIVDDALSLKNQRDQAIHGLWGEKDGRIGLTVMDQGKAGQQRRIEYGRLREIALQIDAINVRFFELAIESCSQANAEFNTATEAWKAMSA